MKLFACLFLERDCKQLLIHTSLTVFNPLPFHLLSFSISFFFLYWLNKKSVKMIGLSSLLNLVAAASHHFLLIYNPPFLRGVYQFKFCVENHREKRGVTKANCCQKCAKFDGKLTCLPGNLQQNLMIAAHTPVFNRCSGVVAGVTCKFA